MIECIPIDPHNDERWLKYITTSKQATVFHHPDWMRVLEPSYDYRLQCQAVVEGNTVIGVLPLMEIESWLTGHRAVCLPFSDACKPLSDNPDVEALLVSTSIALSKINQWKYLEFRGPITHESLHPSAGYKAHILDLDRDPDKVFSQFKKTQIQQSIQRAVRDGVVIERRNDLNAMRDFIHLNALTRRKHGIPPQPDIFFINFQKYLIEKKHGFISVAKIGDQVIAASICLFFNNVIYYKYNASDEKFLKYCPNHLLVWDSILWGCTEGYQTFDFGRTDVSNNGLLFYKRGWGGVEMDLVYYRWDGRNESVNNHRERALDRVKPLFKILPIPILKVIGKKLYGHAG